MPDAAVTVQQYLTWEGLGALGGATVAVVIVTTVIRKLIKGANSSNVTPWVAFVVSMVIVYGVGYFSGQFQPPSNLPVGGHSKYVGGQAFLLFLNGCLLFCSATGANETLVVVRNGNGSRREERKEDARPMTGPGRTTVTSRAAARFFGSWFRPPSGRNLT